MYDTRKYNTRKCHCEGQTFFQENVSRRDHLLSRHLPKPHGKFITAEFADAAGVGTNEVKYFNPLQFLMRYFPP